MDKVTEDAQKPEKEEGVFERIKNFFTPKLEELDQKISTQQKVPEQEPKAEETETPLWMQFGFPSQEEFDNYTKNLEIADKVDAAVIKTQVGLIDTQKELQKKIDTQQKWIKDSTEQGIRGIIDMRLMAMEDVDEKTRFLIAEKALERLNTRVAPEFRSDIGEIDNALYATIRGVIKNPEKEKEIIYGKGGRSSFPMFNPPAKAPSSGHIELTAKQKAIASHFNIPEEAYAKHYEQILKAEKGEEEEL